MFHQRLIDGMVKGFDGDPEHQCMGRSAPQRMARALAQAEQLGVEMPAIKKIAAKQN